MILKTYFFFFYDCSQRVNALTVDATSPVSCGPTYAVVLKHLCAPGWCQCYLLKGKARLADQGSL